jgi:uncharacterized protein (DUF983 family)
MLWRGLTKRCARCGSRHLFRRWFTMVSDCPRCGLHFEREAGYWAGALAINLIIVGGVFVVAFVILLVLTVPDVPVAPVLAVLVPLAVIGPMIAYPFSKTLWVAVDRAFLQKLDSRERADEQIRRY